MEDEDEISGRVVYSPGSGLHKDDFRGARKTAPRQCVCGHNVTKDELGYYLCPVCDGDDDESDLVEDTLDLIDSMND